MPVRTDTPILTKEFLRPSKKLSKRVELLGVKYPIIIVFLAAIILLAIGIIYSSNLLIVMGGVTLAVFAIVAVIFIPIYGYFGIYKGLSSTNPITMWAVVIWLASVIIFILMGIERSTDTSMILSGEKFSFIWDGIINSFLSLVFALVVIALAKTKVRSLFLIVYIIIIFIMM